MEVAINSFCDHAKDKIIDVNGPHKSAHKLGFWDTIHFTGYSISALYIGIEHINDTECINEKLENLPETVCRENLMRIVDHCKFISYSLPYFSNVNGHDPLSLREHADTFDR